LTLVDRESATLPLISQAELLSVSRASLYYQPRGPGGLELRVKRRLDEIYTEHPFLGSRKLMRLLALEGVQVGRHTIRRYRAEMGLEAVYAKPRLSQPSDQSDRVYPYLLRGLEIHRPNQVWGVDITYIRLTSGWMYLVAILDWFSRYVIAWELDDTLEIGFVLACADSALGRAAPEIINSDQGSHFTSERFTQRFLKAGSRISMDGRGRCMDNIFTERLWRSIKYEEVYLTEYASPKEARIGLARYLSYYNKERLHQALGYNTPAQLYRQADEHSEKGYTLKIAHSLS
jgi:putative transposase